MSDDLFVHAQREGILVDFFILPASLLGVYYRTMGKPPVILLHSRLKDIPRLLRCVLAEELGHHHTTGMDLLSFARNSRYAAMKYERQSLWWATKFLIPLDQLTEACLNGITGIYALSEHFFVTERFVWTGLELYNEKMPDKMKAINILLQGREQWPDTFKKKETIGT